MRKLSLLICVGIVITAFAIPVAAQDKAKTSEKAAPSQAEKPASKSDEKSAPDTIDLDTFFKKGEENAKTSSCDKPAKPAEPIA